MTALFTPWWRADQYDWLSGYLASRRLSGATRAVMASIAASMVLCLLALLAGSDGPRGQVPVAMMWVAVAGGVAGVLLWVWRWPTRRQSVAFAVTCNIAVALACLAHPNPLAALIGCIAFATFGAYMAFFHTTGFVLYNFAVAAAVGSWEALSLARSGHPSLAGVDLWLVIEVNIALPLAIRVLVRALSGDLLTADRDPLTGLLNRRAFQHEALGMILARRGIDSHLVVMLIDLDSFKALNDRCGHAAGDHALVQVAQALLAAADDQAVAARSGGEEFLLAGTSAGCNAESLSARMCRAIAASTAGVTASIGTACARLDDTAVEPQALLSELITAADAAMYQAKRLGGNRTSHHELC
ncbi:diguanylate cyclase [Mycobacterium sp. 852002-53434_SCH5985345]|uniref:GGDEF domain-containing protein n=1 Tax=unclassified Mycobacterium TaxID=2642494 RepID=UPI000801B7B5|nr:MULTISPECIES: GGDEF domain-containing protein [unclassified Mycobacterium]OBF61424.1 diguanylate cyclase [Mycobacterium sp. 852002-53434_SCH5985345]OBF73429.1 diguanylate cyclase [Mycobacterium sp. 852002-51613_SCH5001154]